jgi:RNA polymerase sigma-70 factor (ECF subfamily)
MDGGLAPLIQMKSEADDLTVSVSLDHAVMAATISIDVSRSGHQDAASARALLLQATVRRWSMDRDLVARARGGDPDAFSVLCRQIGTRLFAIAYNILGDRGAAEDATQQALVDIWRHLPKLRDVASFDAWTYRVVANAAYAEGGRLRRWAVAPQELPASAAGGDHVHQLAQRDELDRAMARLTMEQRAVLVLKHVADLRDEEIASVLEIPVGTVRSRLHHAHGQLRAALDAEVRADPFGSTR